MFIFFVIPIITTLIAPLTGIIVFTSKLIGKFVPFLRKWITPFLLLVGAILFTIGLLTSQPCIPLELAKSFLARVDLWELFPDITYQPLTVFDYLISDFRTLGICIIVGSLSILATHFTPDNLLLRYESRKESKRQHLSKIDRVSKSNQLCFGVSGAGKTAYLSRMIQDTLTSDMKACIIVVDGKGSTEKYSLYDNLSKLSTKYNRPLVLLNGTTNNNLDCCVYDFLDGVTTADSAKDMVMSLIVDPTVEQSAGSEHYKIITEAYVLSVIRFMLNHRIDVTLSNVLQLLSPENIKAVLDSIENVDLTERDELLNRIDNSWNDVRSNVEKLRMLLDGQGQNIFVGNGQERLNVRSAYESGAIVLVLADEMSMPSLSQKLVNLVSMDVRALVAGRLTGKIDMSNHVYVIYDEFTSYVSALPTVRSIYARCRSAEVSLTLATQSASDIIGLGAGWFDSIINTCDRFIVFRQNGAESPEACANLFGTELHVTTTARSSDFDFTGEASNTADREFIVHPDTIRNLKNNYGILFDKKQNKLSFFKNEFITL